MAGAASAAGGKQGGAIEICKDAVAGDGVAGQPFSFTLMKGTTTIATGIPVTGGLCSASIPVASTTGTYKAIEDLSSGAYMMTGASITNGTLVKTTLSTGTISFTMGPTALGETEVHVTNSIVGSTLKVCKVSQAFLKTEYSFTVAGQPATATSGAQPGVAGQCSQAFTFATGAVVTVTESVPPNEQVTNVTATTGKILSQSLTTPPTSTKNGTYTVTVRIRQGANALTFDNEPQGPSQRGQLEICKSSGGDPFVSQLATPVQFTVTDSAGKPVKVPVFVDQCSNAIDVAAGNVEVDETIPDHQFVQGISVKSPGQLGPYNLNNGTAVVVVPVASAGEAQITFTDNELTGQLKVCKALTATSAALAGSKFKFSVTDDGLPPGSKGSPGNPITVNIVAATGSGACVILTANGKAVGPLNPALQLPEGSTATVTEDLSSYAPYVTSDNATGTTVITTGINAITITNQALGQIEICKDMIAADSPYSNFVFAFTYKNTDPTVTDPRASGSAAVSPNHCTQPILVPPGKYSIFEDLSKTTTTGGAPVPGFLFDHSFANSGPGTPSRCVPPDNSAAPNCGNPLVVTVPYFNDATTPGETSVHFFNKVPRTSVKVCKQIDPGSVGDLAVSGVSYTFTITQTVNGSTTAVGAGKYTVDPPYPPSPNHPASCTDVVGSIPRFNADGTPTTVTVTESPGAGYSVQSITVLPGTPIAGSPDLAGGTVTFNTAPGPDIVTFTNSAPVLLCFSGTTDGTPNFGGTCTIEPGGQAGDLDTLDCPYPFPPDSSSGCYAGVYRAFEPITGEPIGSVASLQFTYTGGPLIGGSPRFSVPIDTNNDGITDFYLFADAPLCDPTHTGTVDPIHNPLCQIFDQVDGVTTWAFVVANHPTWKVSAGDLTFVIADQPYKGTISNVVFGP
jgi:hypothetical protein